MLEGVVSGLMSREAELLARLKELLVREHAEVQAKDGAALQRRAEEKRLLITQLEGVSRERGLLLSAQGLANNAEGFDSLLSRIEGAGRAEAEAHWADVRELLDFCHKQNRVNGLLLDASLRTTHEVLGILLGRAHEGNTYNSQGSLNGGSGTTRTYAKV